jgi:glycosyltransferase involved in cell wall biosynthesis
MRRLRVAVIHPQPRVGGGSENKALWILQTLKDTADVFFIAMGKIDLEELNKFYGTNLSRRDIKLIEIPIPFILKKRFDALRSFRLDRYIRKNASCFDIIISSYNLMDFGTTGIQFLSDFSFVDELRRSLLKKPEGPMGWFYNRSLLRSAYLKLSKLLSGGNSEGWKKNWTIANSDWGGNIFEEKFRIKTRTIYPPVIMDCQNVPWESRENGFLSIGRIVPEKQVDRIISILKRVRLDGYNIHLHILGKGNDLSYKKRIDKLISDNREWVFSEGIVFGSRKNDLLASHKYGLHACENELIGNAVIEMVKAGCLVWVPEKGGPAEIVGRSELIYRDNSEAVRKIEEVLDKDDLARSIRSHLKEKSSKFSLENFQAQIRALIEQFVNRNE